MLQPTLANGRRSTGGDAGERVTLLLLLRPQQQLRSVAVGVAGVVVAGAEGVADVAGGLGSGATEAQTRRQATFGLRWRHGMRPAFGRTGAVAGVVVVDSMQPKIAMRPPQPSQLKSDPVTRNPHQAVRAEPGCPTACRPQLQPPLLLLQPRPHCRASV